MSEAKERARFKRAEEHGETIRQALWRLMVPDYEAMADVDALLSRISELEATLPSVQEIQGILTDEWTKPASLEIKDARRAALTLTAELEAAATREERLREAARPMARLPYPVSSDERDQWRVHQQKLRAALSETGES